MLRTVAFCFALTLAAAPVKVGTARGAVVLDLEDYVAAVVSGEAGGIAEPEALKAIAVAARTYATAFAGRHASEGFDFCETTHCQDARLDPPPRRVIEAVTAVNGLRLYYRGRIVRAFYHQDCGGRTAPAEELWPGAGQPYLVAVDDAPWHAAPPWETRIEPRDLSRALGLAAVRRVSIERRGATGRVMTLSVDGRSIDGERFQMLVGRALGWNRLRGRKYEVEDFVFRGSGAGHGVGLCQVGAQARAKAGRPWREILSTYYPGTAVQGPEWRKVSSERVDVFFVVAEPAAAVDRAAAEAERLAGWTFRDRPRVRVYPTLDGFRDATGEPGFVAASTRGSEVRIRPGTMSSLTHEFIHVLLNQRTRRPVPLWFEEGLALCLAEPGTSARGREDDAVLLNAPRTEVELRRGYEGARARVTRLLRTHGRPAVLAWLETGLPSSQPR